MLVGGMQPAHADDFIEQLGQWFGGKQKPAAVQDEPVDEPEPNRPPRDIREPDAIDQRLSAAAPVQRQFSRIRRAIDDGAVSEAADALHQILAEPIDTPLWDESAGRPRTSKNWARELLAGLPPAERDRVIDARAAAAAAALQQAQRSGQAEPLWSVAQRFPLNSEGHRAAVLWGQTQLAAGRPQTVRRMLDGMQPLLDLVAVDTRDRLARLDRQSADALDRLRGSGPDLGLDDDAAAAVVPLPLWEQPALLGNIGEAVDNLEFDLESQRLPRMPLAEPVVAGSRLVWRDLNSLHAASIADGTGWSSVQDDSFIRTIAKLGRDSRTADYQRSRLLDASGGDQSAIATHLYRDSTFSNLSTDRRHIYSVVDEVRLELAQMPLNNRRELTIERDSSGRYESNRLVARDLRTGRVVWELGGADRRDVFDRPLAGDYFFGPPLPLERKLYAVVERDGEIALQVIDAATGQPLWRQPLASADRSVALSPSRRQWASRPVLAGGLIVVQTHQGWVVAIDRQMREVAWTARVLPESEGRNEYGMHMEVESLGEAWQPAPLIVREGLIYITRLARTTSYSATTPPTVYVLDAATGQLAYRVARDSRYDDLVCLCGFDGARPIFAGRGRLVAFEPPEWTPRIGPPQPVARDAEVLDSPVASRAWSRELPDGSEIVGRPQQIERRLYVPVGGDELWTYNLDASPGDGPAERRAWLGRLPLGNLTLVQTEADRSSWRLASQSTAGVSLMATERELQLDPASIDLTRASAEDFSQLLSVAIAVGEPDTLRQVVAAAIARLPSIDRGTFDLVVRAVQRLDQIGQRVDQRQLQTLLRSADRSQSRLALTRVSMSQSGDSFAAIRLLLELADDQSILQPLIETDGRAERGSAWWVRELRTRAAALPDAERAELDRVLKAKLQQSDSDLAILIAEAGLIPDSLTTIARRWLLDGRDREADRLLATLASELRRPGHDRDTRYDAAIAMIRSQATRRRFGPVDSAASLAASQVSAASGLNGQGLGGQGLGRQGLGGLGDETTPAQPFPDAWRPESIRVRTAAARRQWGMERSVVPVRRHQALPSLLATAFQHDDSSNRVFAFDGGTGRMLGDFGLPDDEAKIAVQLTVDRDLLLVEMPHSVLAVDGSTFKTLWTHRREPNLTDARVSPFSSVTLQPLNQPQRHSSRSPQPGIIGATATRVILREGRELVALDRWTGRPAWTRPQSLTGRVDVSDSGVFLYETRTPEGRISRNAGPIRWLRGSDGQPYDLVLGETDRHGRRRSLTWAEAAGRHVVGLIGGHASERPRLVAYTLEPIDGVADRLQLAADWERPIPTASIPGTLQVDDLNPKLVYIADAQLVFVDVATGETRRGDPITSLKNERGRMRVHLARDADRFYLAVDDNSGNNRSGYLATATDSIRVSGQIAAIDAKSAEVLWQSSVPSSYLLTGQVPGTPFLIFLDSRMRKIEGQTLWRLSTRLVDKRDGSVVLLDQRDVTDRSGPGRVAYRFGEDLLEMKLQQSRLLITNGAD